VKGFEHERDVAAGLATFFAKEVPRYAPAMSNAGEHAKVSPAELLDAGNAIIRTDAAGGLRECRRHDSLSYGATELPSRYSRKRPDEDSPVDASLK
jgi:hypothetical protein